MVEVLGSRARLDELLEADARRAIRVNRLKTDPKEITHRLAALGIETEPIDWAKDAFFTRDPQQRALGSLWEHRSGQFFVQDPASTIPIEALDPQPGDRVLDLCAAPGSKTTHIAERLANDGLVVANDRHPGRVNNLISNLDQTGALTAVATQYDGCRLAWPLAFDRVLVDAPCSNLGNMHEDWQPIQRYDGDHIQRLTGIQQALLTSAFHAVREGGRIVYSTCTIEPEENEAIVDWFLSAFPIEIEPIDLPVGEPAKAEIAGERYDGDVQAARRIWAGDHSSESFFAAAFTKQAEAGAQAPQGAQAKTEDNVGSGRLREPVGHGLDIEPASAGVLDEIQEAYGLEDTVLDEARALATSSKLYASLAPGLEELLAMGVDRVGTYLARREQLGYRLSFAAAMLVGEHAHQRIELAPEQARLWLSGQSVEIGRKGHPRWSIVTCEGEALGCARAFGDELPSYVPKRYRSPDPEADVLGFLPMQG